ncbi:MAG: hypothetical protein C5S49_03640 [Candidatus Methanogaster sp.]|nr:MAG: hypothetical protein C5S49_03640 [ANME-2 cluster archaeon]
MAKEMIIDATECIRSCHFLCAFVLSVVFQNLIPEDNKKWLFGNSREIDLHDKSSK